MSQQLLREIEFARVLKEQIIAAGGDDPDFIRDGIEGETGLFEIIDKLVENDGEDDALIEASAAYIDTLKSRLDRIKKRKETRRALIGLALELAETKKRETPSGTVTLQKVQPSAIVTEEAEIPSEFWKPQAPKLDKRALTEALKSGATIPGATLSNGGVTTRILRS